MDPRTRLLRLGLQRNEYPARVHERPAASKPSLESLIDGEWVSVCGARCFVAERTYPWDHSHGFLSLSELPSLPGEEWQAMTLAAAGQPFDPRRAAFIDIETTGLARGSGTYAFLVGVGFSSDLGFVVRQYFMPDYDHEEALLDLLAKDLSNMAALISFNGRSFDWPILEARYVISRRRPPCGGVPHLDLLLLARRLWGSVFPSCSLSFLEPAALGIRRDGKDTPGRLVPQLYQGYVRWGHTRPMVGVFYHNAMDVLSLVVLMARLARVISPRFRGEPDPLRDDLSLGKFFERAGLVEDALRAYEMASRRSSRPALVSEARKRLSFLLKRLGRYDEAMQVWRVQLKGDEIYPYIELAKQLEHRLRDYAQASRVTRQAIAWVQAGRARMDRVKHQSLMAQLERRLARVERRRPRSRPSNNTFT